MDSVNKKGVVVIGSTGSIGQQALEVLAGLRERFRVVGLAAGRNYALLLDQARLFHPKLLWCDQGGPHEAPDIHRLPMEEMAAHPEADIVLVATVGKAGLAPTLAALRAGKTVALANKEVLVMAGHLVMAAAREHGGQVRPVDSEHSAIWQCLWGEDPRAISRLMLTASGGPFRDWPLAELSRVTAEEALRHPTWSMGPKITVDSATLLNKGLEVIEARWLFDVPFERIEIVLHRESIVHSLVEFRDGSVKAQLGLPDMRLPIQLALTYPERLPASAPRLELGSVGALHFEAVDRQRFPCLELALEAGRRGGTYPAVLAAADEVAVGLFLTGSIGFLDIPRLLADSLEAHQPIANPSLEEILAADTWARAWLDERLRAGPQARVGWV